MPYLIIGTVCLLLFFVLLHRDPRSFVNVLVLLAAAVLLFIGLAEAGQHVEYISGGLVLFLFGFVPLSMLFIAVLLILNGFFMLKREGRRLANLLSMLAGFALIAGMIATGSMVVASTPNTMLMSVLWLGSILTVYLSATFTALLVYSLLYLKLPKDMQCDYIIVHGCGLLDGDRVSPLLKGRVDRAVEVYRKLDGRAKLVLSGGQGPDEKISEARAMENYLLGQGFSTDALILEDRSATTYENLRNVRNMLGGGKEHRYLFVTNDYHVFRTGMFARDLGMNAAGIGCKTAMYYWPSAFIREYIAIMVRYKWITVGVLLLWLALTIVSLLPF
jgi:uncharacterized SAM-binding protein YcdF (DUF218 family)